jgi:hypothetical protein
MISIILTLLFAHQLAAQWAPEPQPWNPAANDTLCKGVVNVTGDSGEIVSNKDPDSSYDNNMYCGWNIILSSSTTVVVNIQTNIELNFDFVTILQNSGEVIKISGNNDTTLKITGSFVVEFKTDSSVTFPFGFKLTWSYDTIQPSVINNVLNYTESGVYSYFWTDYYPDPWSSDEEYPYYSWYLNDGVDSCSNGWMSKWNDTHTLYVVVYQRVKPHEIRLKTAFDCPYPISYWELYATEDWFTWDLLDTAYGQDTTYWVKRPLASDRYYYYFKLVIYNPRGVVELSEIELSGSLEYLPPSTTGSPSSPTWEPSSTTGSPSSPTWEPSSTTGFPPPSGNPPGFAPFPGQGTYTYNALRDVNAGQVIISSSATASCEGYRPEAIADGYYWDCSTFYAWRGISQSRYMYLQIQLDTPLMPTSYAFLYSSYCTLFSANSHSVYASNDGLNWDTLVWWGGSTLSFYELYFDWPVTRGYRYFRFLFHDSYVVDISELELRGYFVPGTIGGGGKEVCSDNVLRDDLISGGTVITASSTYTTYDIWSSPSPDALIDGIADCQMRTRWKSAPSPQSVHQVYITTRNPIVATSFNLTAPSTYCSPSWPGTDYYYYYYSIYGATSGGPSGNWNYLAYDYAWVMSGESHTTSLFSSTAYKYYKIEFYSYQVEVRNIYGRLLFYWVPFIE